ncbi:MAG: MerR family transcriptional regulator [bacterium]|nr:MerR family transcriptional regulator [bacterium]
MAELSIGEVARQAGIRTSTLRYYESIGLLPAPHRVSGRRRYDASVLQRLAIIRTAQQAGFTLGELRVLLEALIQGSAPAEEWQALLQHKLGEIEVMLTNIRRMKSLLEDMMRCEQDYLAECIYVVGLRHSSTEKIINHGNAKGAIHRTAPTEIENRRT